MVIVFVMAGVVCLWWEGKHCGLVRGRMELQPPHGLLCVSSRNRPFILASWRDFSYVRLACEAVSCRRPVACFSLSLLWTSASSAVFHRMSVLLVCCAEQGMGEYMEAHDRLATGLASWMMECVHWSFACPVVMCPCAMVRPSRCFVCACLCPRRRLGRDRNGSECTCTVRTNVIAHRCFTLPHPLRTSSCPLLVLLCRSCCIMAPLFSIVVSVLPARPRCTRVHRSDSGQ
jgi:hypothetical protein